MVFLTVPRLERKFLLPVLLEADVAGFLGSALKKSTPIVSPNGFSAHPNAEKICLEAGADDFISKPFEMNELIDKIIFFLEQKEVKQVQ